ncbi:MAG: CHAT domain-containing protein [Oscillochloris sp.]|nr:CHAT domain-containing protein [Oscillochloris sp.]
MSEVADLEIGLRRHAEGYTVELRFSEPESEADIRPAQSCSARASFDLAYLNTLALDSAAYGRALGNMLFADINLRADFVRCRSVAQAKDYALRLRLLIAPDAADLQVLHWETLRDPHDDTALAVGEQTYLVRYLLSGDWQPVRLRARSALRALVVIANPAGLERYSLQPINLTVERDLALAGLGDIATEVIAGPIRPTIDVILERLRDGYDVFYLVCHGGLMQGESWLALEDEQGNLDRVSGAELACRMRELALRPRLTLLVSCQSGSDGTTAVFNTLAQSLSEAGVPAVLAMQGVVSVDTARLFVSTFCAELRRDGCIDRAAGVARGVVRDRPDSWMPALYSRLRNGRIWYVPGFGDEQASFQKWPTLLRSICDGRCTPILGFGLLEPLIGSSREIARRWADSYGFPLTAGREDLPQVAQFLAVDQDAHFVYSELRETVSREIYRRFGGADVAQGRSPASLDYLLNAAAAQQVARDPFSPQRVLASLPFPFYISASPDSLLVRALAEVGRTPLVASYPWNDQIDTMDDPDCSEVTANRPLVYHLFGQLTDPESLVLTEDDYFSYLMSLSRNRNLVPKIVRGRLTETSLLFLGFRLDEWSFRVLFHSVMNREVQNRRRRNTHVAVQIDLDEHQAAKPDQARRYLERYFGDADISIYWGSAEDFLRELAERNTAQR